MTYHSYDGHGVDVAIKRADDLDRKALQYIADHPDCKVLDVGSGAGGQSLRMVEAGAHVTAIDQFDFTEQFASYDHPVDRLRFVVGNIHQIPELLKGETFDIALCQRTIHHVPYAAALLCLQQLHSVIQVKLYISVTGSGSLVGETYPGVAQPLAERFCELSSLGKEMFSIVEPVCLYNQTEFIELLESAGWTVDECWESAFGNSKAVCSK